ncbi:hypothetical protein Holit_02988 [Hollandina sp. SP2]
MKKFIALSAVLVILAGAGFAEVAITGTADAVVMPLQVIAPDGGDAQIGAAVGRNGSDMAPRVRIGVKGETEQVGINFMIQFFSTKEYGIDDFAEVWWKPISPLKIEAGKFVNDTLRGKIGDDNWNNYTVKMKDADSIFSRFKSTWSGTVGFMLGLTPIEPLYIGISVPGVDQLAKAATAGGNPDQIKTYTEDGDEVGNIVHTYENIQAAIGYTIPNIGLFRVQYVGFSSLYALDSKGETTDPSYTDFTKARRIEAAFAFTGMSGLVIDVGGKVPLPVDTYYQEEKTPGSGYTKKTDTTYQVPYQVSLGASYTADALKINGRVDAQFGGKKETSTTEDKQGMDINVHLWPSYNLGFATAGLDLGFNYIGDTTDKDDNTITEGGYMFGAGVWLQKAYGASSIKGGLALSLGENNGNKLDTVFSVPIIFNYSF